MKLVRWWFIQIGFVFGYNLAIHMSSIFLCRFDWKKKKRATSYKQNRITVFTSWRVEWFEKPRSKFWPMCMRQSKMLYVIFRKTWLLSIKSLFSNCKANLASWKPKKVISWENWAPKGLICLINFEKLKNIAQIHWESLYKGGRFISVPVYSIN